MDAEFAVLVRSDLKGLGLGRRLMEKLITYTRDHGLQRLMVLRCQTIVAWWR
ncbi:GNAT family N-acetyltransferase [Shigella flexneri]